MKIIGTGPDAARLRALAGPDVEFLGHVDDTVLRQAYRGARALLMPGEEDFGIAPVEAQTCGRPVIALSRGGALETIVDGVSGFLVDDERPAAFAEAMAAVDTLPLSSADLPHTRPGVQHRTLRGGVRGAYHRNTGGPGDMVKRFSRLFVLLHIAGDISCAAVAFVAAYLIRFETGLLDIPKGQPPLDQYLSVLPFVALTVPIAFHMRASGQSAAGPFHKFGCRGGCQGR